MLSCYFFIRLWYSGMIGWHANAQQSGFIPPVFLPLGMSMNRLMVAVVDDAAHGIWAGGNKDMPLSRHESVEIEMNTFQLQAAATLVLSIGATGPSGPRLGNFPAFQEKARKLSDLAVTARTAVAAKNQMALRTAGDTLVDVCNDCHDVFNRASPPRAYCSNEATVTKIGGLRTRRRLVHGAQVLARSPCHIRPLTFTAYTRRVDSIPNTGLA